MDFLIYLKHYCTSAPPIITSLSGSSARGMLREDLEASGKQKNRESRAMAGACSVIRN